MSVMILKPVSGRLDKAISEAYKIALAFPKITFYLEFNQTRVMVSDAINERQILENYYEIQGNPIAAK